MREETIPVKHTTTTQTVFDDQKIKHSNYVHWQTLVSTISNSK